MGLLANAGLLSLGAIILLLSAVYWFPDQRRPSYKIALGVTFGLIAMSVVLMAVNISDGIAADTRAAPLVLAGFLGGLPAAVLSAGIASIAVLINGGPAQALHIAELLVYATLGYLVYELTLRRGRREIRFRHLLMIALGVTAVILPVNIIGRPFDEAISILARVWWPVAFANGVGIAILGTSYIALERMRRRAYDAENAIAQSRVALKASDAGLWFFEPADNIIELDDLSAVIVGGPRQRIRFSLDDFAARLHPDDGARMLGAFGRASGDGLRFSIRCRRIREDGGISYIEITAQSTNIDLPRSRIVGTLRDVTAEEEGLTRIRLNNLALDKAANGVIICRADGDMPIVYVNDAFSMTTGYAPAEVLGRNCRFLNEPEPDQEGLETIRDAIRNGRSCVAEVRNYRKDGTPFWNRIRMAPIRDQAGELTHYVGILHDTTHQHEIEAIANRHKERLEAVLSSAPDAIVTVDDQMTINEFNTAAERLFGWSRADIIGRPLHVLVPSIHAPRHDDLARRFLQSGDAGTRVMADWRNIQGMRADGTTFPVLVTLSRFTVDGRPSVTAIARDMSSVAEMNRELFEMSNQLSRQLHDVQAANDAKTRFLASMSHELRTPLNAIIGFSEAMRERYFGPIGNAKYEEYVQDINASALHLLSLINDLLDLTAIENGRLTLNVQPLAVGEIINGAAVSVTTLLGAKSLNLSIDDATDGWAILADRRALHQCLLNLLSNAIKFTPAGGNISVAAKISDLGGLTLSVADNGIGIPADKIDRLGVPFEQVGDPMHAETKGTGLGLAITKRLVESMSGTMRIESELDRGTTVYLHFPKAIPRSFLGGGGGAEDPEAAAAAC